MANGNNKTSNKRKTELENAKLELELEKAKLDLEQQKAKAAIELETSEINAETARHKAETAKHQAEAAKHQVENALSLRSLTDQKTLLDAQKNIALSQAGLATAQTDAAIAKYIGTTTAGPYSGAVKREAGAGKTEAHLLAARAVNEAAHRIAVSTNAAISNSENDTIESVSIFHLKDFQGFHSVNEFKARIAIFERAFDDLGIPKSPPVPPSLGNETKRFAIPAMVSAGLSGLANILGYLKTDYTIGGTDVTTDDSVLSFAVAGALKSIIGNKKIYHPLAYQDPSDDMTVTAFLEALKPVSQHRQAATEMAQDIAQLENSNTSETILNEKKAKHTQLVELVKSFDEFIISLAKPDNKGVVPITTILQEFAIAKACQDGVVLLLNLEHSGGGYLMKKNLLTGLGAMPLYHMGGASVTYLLLKSADASVLCGDAIPIHGGYAKTNKIRALLKRVWWQ